MTNEGYGLALNYQAARELQAQRAPLDADVQNRLDEHLQMMEEIVERTIAVQDAVSCIYANTLMVADASMAAKAFVKAARHSSGAESGLEEFERLQTVRLLEVLRQISKDATHTVMEEAF